MIPVAPWVFLVFLSIDLKLELFQKLQPFFLLNLYAMQVPIQTAMQVPIQTVSTAIFNQ